MSHDYAYISFLGPRSYFWGENLLDYNEKNNYQTSKEGCSNPYIDPEILEK